MKTEFPRQYLAAAAVLMAVNEARYYLNGVLVESMPCETRIAATDGNVAGVLRHERMNSDNFEVIVPAGVIAIAVKLPGEFLALECADGKWSLGGVPFVPVDGKFPDYRRVIPSACSGERGDFNPELLMRFVKVGKALKRRDSPILRQNGTGSALVHFYAFDNFVGVCMPMRMFTEKTPDLGVPTWAQNR